MRLLVFFAALFAAWFAVSPAWAFHEIASFSRSANTGGGAGYYYSGSPRSKGYDCTACHVDAPGSISIELDTDLRTGRYRPGLIYPMTVRLIGEHRGLDSAFNPNTFAAEIVDDQGQPLGRLVGGGGTVESVEDGAVAIAEGFGNGESEWSLSWWSPEEAASATLHLALLDGDGAREPERRFIDPIGDDVAVARLRLCPEGSECPAAAPPSEEEPSAVGCRAGAGSEPGAALLVLLACAVVQRRRLAIASLLLVPFVACAGSSAVGPVHPASVVPSEQRVAVERVTLGDAVSATAKAASPRHSELEVLEWRSSIAAGLGLVFRETPRSAGLFRQDQATLQLERAPDDRSALLASLDQPVRVAHGGASGHSPAGTPKRERYVAVVRLVGTLTEDGGAHELDVAGRSTTTSRDGAPEELVREALEGALAELHHPASPATRSLPAGPTR